jgi:GT2 family glycosyltransferase
MIELAAPEDPAVSVIVLLDGAVEMAERCLTALARCEQSVPFETVLLLNDPSPELESFVKRSTRGGRTVLCRANAGPGVGWNLGAAVARAPRLASLHEDSEPAADWLAPLVEAMDREEAGAVGARLYNRDGSVQNCGWVLFADSSHQPLTPAAAPAVAAASEPTPADMLSGAAMLIDRDVLRTFGGWDERFHPAVFVDIDVSTSVWNLGKPVLSVPASRVVHQGLAFDSRSDSPLTGPRLRTVLFERNSVPFLEKWGSFVADRPAPPSEPDSAAPAVAAALELTRERAERIRSGNWRSPRPDARAKARFSGLAEQPVIEAGDGAFRVAPEVEEALRGAEAELIGAYCLWLVRKEEFEFARLLTAHRENQRREQETIALRDERDALARERAELAAACDRISRDRHELDRRLHQILNGRTWRLRSAVMRRFGR